MIIGLSFTIAIIIAFAGVFIEFIRQQTLPPEKQYHGPRPPKVDPTDIVIDGKSLDLTTADIAAILTKRFPYYKTLRPYHQQLFLKRTIQFLHHKMFIIKADSGFKEMPVLATASAIQLTFGLKDFLLPWFRYIQIYPEEFWADHSLKVLAGNVSNRTISVAWNHLLKGIEDTTDGANVGLHEMSHALYYQMVEIEKLDAASFCNRYNRLLDHCAVAFKYEVSGRYDLYSDYATTNLQEFWAESIELFFEKGGELKRTYPEVFTSLTILLKQNPLAKDNGIKHCRNLVEVVADGFKKWKTNKISQ